MEKIGPLVMDLEGVEITPLEKELLQHPNVGGVVLFARNYADKKQLSAFCADIRAARKKPLLIMVDQEGGRVQRFKDEFTLLPALARLGDLYAQDAQQALHWARECAWLMATEISMAGLDLSLAPVLDLNNRNNPAIAERAFHDNPTVVIELATQYIAGMHEAKMAATGKHFPGHGSTVLDTHVANPIDERSLAEIKTTDLLPFSIMIQKGLNAIMASHLIYPKIDATPVGFSAVWLKKILRETLQFKGAILTDDLNMQGANISNSYADRVHAALVAGCDFALLCNNRVGVIDVLDHLPEQKFAVAETVWRLLQKKTAPVFDAKRHAQVVDFIHTNSKSVKLC